MTGLSAAPRVARGSLVLLDPHTAAILRTIHLQYNPDTMSRTLQVQATGADEGGRSQPLRFKSPPVETLKLEVELDATDALTQARPGDVAVEHGIHPQLAALESLVYPTSDELLASHRLAARGTLEILAPEAPLVLFSWGRSRVAPVRVTDLSVTEEAFDPLLNPLRAKVSLGLRVLSVHDLGFDHPGSNLYLVHHRLKETLAALGGFR